MGLKIQSRERVRDFYDIFSFIHCAVVWVNESYLDTLVNCDCSQFPIEFENYSQCNPTASLPFQNISNSEMHIWLNTTGKWQQRKENQKIGVILIVDKTPQCPFISCLVAGAFDHITQSSSFWPNHEKRSMFKFPFFHCYIPSPSLLLYLFILHTFVLFGPLWDPTVCRIPLLKPLLYAFIISTLIFSQARIT